MAGDIAYFLHVTGIDKNEFNKTLKNFRTTSSGGIIDAGNLAVFKKFSDSFRGWYIVYGRGKAKKVSRENIFRDLNSYPVIDAAIVIPEDYLAASGLDSVVLYSEGMPKGKLCVEKGIFGRKKYSVEDMT